MIPHTITLAVGAVISYKANEGLWCSPRGIHTQTIVNTAEIESGFVAKHDLVPLRCSPVCSCAAPLQTVVTMGGCQGQHTICWEQWTREGTHVRKTVYGATRKTTRREDLRIVRQALVDSTVTRSMIRADVGVAIVPQTICRHFAEANLKSKRPFRALPLTPKTSATTSTVVPSQINEKCHKLA
ncbi:HTH_Tnp_Tc3_2 domain-containing protein [Trichonephila clavipes]|nr:HTH_Tnp_Tc3_2 domain-containing protein [Trichonephila clavipes]